MDPKPHYSTQTKARKAALDILYQAELRGDSVAETFAEQRSLAGREVIKVIARLPKMLSLVPAAG